MRNMNSKKAKTIIIVVGIVVCVLLGMLIYRKAEVFLILRRRVYNHYDDRFSSA